MIQQTKCFLIIIEGGKKLPTNDSKSFAPLLAKKSTTWLDKWGYQQKKKEKEKKEEKYPFSVAV